MIEYEASYYFVSFIGADYVMSPTELEDWYSGSLVGTLFYMVPVLTALSNSSWKTEYSE